MKYYTQIVINKLICIILTIKMIQCALGDLKRLHRYVQLKCDLGKIQALSELNKVAQSHLLHHL